MGVPFGRSAHASVDAVTIVDPRLVLVALLLPPVSLSNRVRQSRSASPSSVSCRATLSRSRHTVAVRAVDRLCRFDGEAVVWITVWLRRWCGIAGTVLATPIRRLPVPRDHRAAVGQVYLTGLGVPGVVVVVISEPYDLVQLHANQTRRMFDSPQSVEPLFGPYTGCSNSRLTLYTFEIWSINALRLFYLC